MSLRKLCLFALAAALAGSQTVGTLNVQIQRIRSADAEVAAARSGTRA
jgi:hypothetical protein